MRRRDFISMVGGGAVTAWPLAARAQQSDRRRHIGVLMSLAEDDAEEQARFRAFVQALQQLGWHEDRNLRIDARWGAGDAGRMRKFATELSAVVPDAILASGGVTMQALLLANRTSPIVFVNVNDPVGAGYGESLARPGGSVTGFTNFEYGTSGKWLELLKQTAPRTTRVAVLRDAAATSGTAQFAAIQAVAPSLGVELTPVGIRDAAGIACSDRIRAEIEWRIDRGCRRFGRGKSSTHCNFGGQASSADGLSLSVLRGCRRLVLLWA